MKSESRGSPLGQAIAVYGHIHQPFVRAVAGVTVINTGSVSQSFDGDPRASYLLIDDGTPKIRRVEYDLEREIKAITASGLDVPRFSLPVVIWKLSFHTTVS